MCCDAFWFEVFVRETGKIRFIGNAILQGTKLSKFTGGYQRISLGDYGGWIFGKKAIKISWDPKS